MRTVGSFALLVLVVGCGEPWVTLGQRAPVDGAAADASLQAPDDAALPAAPPPDDAGVAIPANGGEHSCADDTQCTSGGHPFCDVAQGVCVRCLRDLDCDSMDRCAAGDCVSRD